MLCVASKMRTSSKIRTFCLVLSNLLCVWDLIPQSVWQRWHVGVMWYHCFVNCVVMCDVVPLLCVLCFSMTTATCWFAWTVNDAGVWWASCLRTPAEEPNPSFSLTSGTTLTSLWISCRALPSVSNDVIDYTSVILEQLWILPILFTDVKTYTDVTLDQLYSLPHPLHWRRKLHLCQNGATVEPITSHSLTTLRDVWRHKHLFAHFLQWRQKPY